MGGVYGRGHGGVSWLVSGRGAAGIEHVMALLDLWDTLHVENLEIIGDARFAVKLNDTTNLSIH